MVVLLLVLERASYEDKDKRDDIRRGTETAEAKTQKTYETADVVGNNRPYRL